MLSFTRFVFIETLTASTETWWHFSASVLKCLVFQQYDETRPKCFPRNTDYKNIQGSTSLNKAK